MTTRWHDHPELVDRLAAAYVAGSLRGPAARRLLALAQRHRGVALALADWSARLAPLFDSLPDVPLPAPRWRPPALKPPAAGWRAWVRPGPVLGVALGLLLGLAGPPLWLALRPTAPAQALLPESYVGVLATADGRPGLIVSALRRGREMELKTLAPINVPPGLQAVLWRIDKDGQVSVVAPVPGAGRDKFTRLPLPDEAERLFFPAVELAVSLEPEGSLPAKPTAAFVYRGLCGKFWR
ncbi:MAG: anti-sigma factor domain-containing protein [Aquabacterium sp.]